MKKLFFRLFLLFIPIFICTSTVIIWDPFRIFFDYKDYYKDNIVDPNRSFVLTETYLKYRKETKFNSFIFGSSRSHAYRCKEWQNTLGNTAIPYHFDGATETIFGINKKIKFLDEMGDTMKNVLIICDMTTLANTKNRIDHLHILPPKLSKESPFRFYFEFLKSSFSFEFICAYSDYKLFHKTRLYQKSLLSLEEFPSYHDPINGDYFYGNDQHLIKDSTGYYKEMIALGNFIKEENPVPYPRVTEEETELLIDIAKVFMKHKTNYKIIISPLYNQIPMDKDQLKLLKTVFGDDRVYDFSGKNAITDAIGNYYENSHYKPFIATEIMKKVQ